jgi:hypothetical protein
MAKAATAAGIASGQCLCGKVCFEIDVPARWAWHDHSPASRRAHGAAYATYVGSWRKRFRINSGKDALTRYEDKTTKTARSFCTHCGTPLVYERARSPHMVNIPRALFSGRTGRQPLYHIAIEQLQEWAYTGEPLVPLKGFPGVVWQRSKKKKRLDQALRGRFTVLLCAALARVRFRAGELAGIVATKSTPRFTHFFSPASVR